MRGPHPQPISTDARFLLSQDIVIPQRLIAVFESPTAIPVRGAENAQTPYWTGALCLLLCYSGLIQPPGESADLIRTIRALEIRSYTCKFPRSVSLPPARLSAPERMIQPCAPPVQLLAHQPLVCM